MKVKLTPFIETTKYWVDLFNIGHRYLATERKPLGPTNKKGEIQPG